MTAGVKSSVNLFSADKTESPSPPIARLAASVLIFISPAPRKQGAKRAKKSFSSNVSVMFYLNFKVASATTANNTHKM